MIISLGLAAGKEIDRLSLEGGILYALKTQRARDYEFGDVLELGVSSSYALKQIDNFPTIDLPGKLRPALSRKTKTKAQRSPAAREVLFLSPGLQMDINKQMSAFISRADSGFPESGREHSELDYSVLAGITMFWN